MAFCKKCGTQLQGDERFCVGCGTEVSGTGAASAATGTGTIAAPVAGAVVPAKPGAAAQQVVVGPGHYAPPGTIPITVTLPAQAPAKRGGLMWILIVLAALGGGYYYYKQPKPPATADPSVNSALTKQQTFDAHWQAVNGFVQVSNGKWTNNATVAIDSSTLECDQYDSNGTDLAQMRTTLDGPVQPGSTSTFNPFQMGEVATNVDRVTCTIVHVKAVGSGQ